MKLFKTRLGSFSRPHVQASALARQKVRSTPVHRIAAYRSGRHRRHIVWNGIPGVFFPRRTTRALRSVQQDKKQASATQRDLSVESSSQDQQHLKNPVDALKNAELEDAISFLHIDSEEENEIAENFGWTQSKRQNIEGCLILRMQKVIQVAYILLGYDWHLQPNCLDMDHAYRGIYGISSQGFLRGVASGFRFPTGTKSNHRYLDDFAPIPAMNKYAINLLNTIVNVKDLNPQDLFALLDNEILGDRAEDSDCDISTEKALLATRLLANEPSAFISIFSAEEISNLIKVLCWLLGSKTLDEASRKFTQRGFDPNDAELRVTVLRLWKEVPEYKKFISRVGRWYMKATNDRDYTNHDLRRII